MTDGSAPPVQRGGQLMAATGLWGAESSGLYSLTPVGVLFRARLVNHTLAAMPQNVALSWQTIDRQAVRPSPVRLRRFDLAALASEPKARAPDLLLWLRGVWGQLGVRTELVTTSAGRLALVAKPTSVCLATTLAVLSEDFTVHWGVDGLEVAVIASQRRVALLGDVVVVEFHQNNRSRAVELMRALADSRFRCYRVQALPAHMPYRAGIIIRSKSITLRLPADADRHEDSRFWKMSDAVDALWRFRQQAPVNS